MGGLAGALTIHTYVEEFFDDDDDGTKQMAICHNTTTCAAVYLDRARTDAKLSKTN